MKTPQDVRAIVQALKDLYPDGICSLQYQKDYELLFATRLSAQCTDERVNQVTPALFARFPTLEALAAAEPEEVEPYIHSCGFFRAKARDIVFASRMLLEKYHGKVPGTMEELLSLPGVGRKTANLILGDVHRTPGVVVADTHCIRITGLLGLTDGTKDPGKVEKQLRACLPPEESNGPEAGLLQLHPAPLVRPLPEQQRGVSLCSIAPQGDNPHLLHISLIQTSPDRKPILQSGDVAVFSYCCSRL